MSKNSLKEIREDKGMSATALGNKAGLTKQQIYNFEKNNVGMSLEKVIKIAEVLGVRVDDIVSGNYLESLRHNKKVLEKAMSIAIKHHQNEKDKDSIVGIASELYSIIMQFDKIDEDKKEEFFGLLKNKCNIGLAARYFLDEVRGVENKST